MHEGKGLALDGLDDDSQFNDIESADQNSITI